MMASVTARRIILHQLRRRRLPAGTTALLLQQPCRRRQYSQTNSLLSSNGWWKSFAGGTATRDTNAKVTSVKSTGSDTDDDNPRRLQERKDATLALLALEFRRQSLLHPTKEREQVIDLAFDELEQKELDNKTMLQLRHELQTSLRDQVVELFQAFGKVDEGLGLLSNDLDLDLEDSPMYNPLLQLELEGTIDALVDISHPVLQAPKGADPRGFLELKRRALETLLDRRQQQQATATATTNAKSSSSSPEEVEEERVVSWVDADEFGYHETMVDPEQNSLIRHYQAVNMCRSAKMRDEWGFSVVALQSSIPGAGRGVYVDGYAKAGSIVAFQPGEVWSKEHLMNLPFEMERQLEKNDNYLMSLRPDDFMIDSRKSPYTVLTNNHSNLMALGHVINHPTPSKPPNCRTIMVNFTQGMELGGDLKRFLPNTYARPRNLTLMGSLWDREVVDMHGMCLIATRDIANEELFYDYRLMTPHLPQWYHRMQDTAYEPEEKNGDEEKGQTKA